MKYFFQSKTVLTNLLLIALTFIPGFGGLIARYPEISTIIVALVGIGLRLVTQMPIWIR